MKTIPFATVEEAEQCCPEDIHQETARIETRDPEKS